MQILITNDDGYQAKGIGVLVEIMKEFGDVTVIAPKRHQSGMSMAVSLGLKPIAYRNFGHFNPNPFTGGAEDSAVWSYIDATPASCVKFGLNNVFPEKFPDVVVSGINHGSNAATASCYSGTLGAAEEAALNGIPAIGVSLDTIHPDADFSAVREYFGEIFKKLIENYPQRYGVYYNVNFPDIPASEIKGVRSSVQGIGHWVKEFKDWDPDIYKKYGITPQLLGQPDSPAIEEGEELYMMVGDFMDDERNGDRADHKLMEQGYVSITAHNVDCTDYQEHERLKCLDRNF